MPRAFEKTSTKQGDSAEDTARETPKPRALFFVELCDMNTDRRTQEPATMIATDSRVRVEPNGTEPAVEAVERQPTAVPKNGTSGPGSVLIATLVWGGLGLFWAVKNDTAREFLARWWWAFAAGFVLINGLLLLGGFRRWFKGAAVQKKTAVVVFVVIPALLTGIGGIVFLAPQHPIIFLRLLVVDAGF